MQIHLMVSWLVMVLMLSPVKVSQWVLVLMYLVMKTSVPKLLVSVLLYQVLVLMMPQRLVLQLKFLAYKVG